MEIRSGDLTDEAVDVIVNAANQWLQHGAGVAGTIIRKGGESIQQESNAWVARHGKIAHDKPAYTKAGTLPCRYVIHAVGPVWGEGQEEDKLRRTINGVFLLADRLGASSMAMPPISTGIFGFPREIAAPILFNSIREYWISNAESSLDTIRLTIIDVSTASVFVNEFDRWKEALNNDDE
jgi:O-acetyl-ADP-ribose deacetylase (regulator of RNase III)